MEEKVKEFKEYWDKNYRHISLELEDYEIIDFIQRYGTIELATDGASDYLLSQGLAEVQE